MLEAIERYYKNISGIEAQVKDKIEKLKRNKDVMEEFANWINTKKYSVPGVEVEGYTAEKLAAMSRFLQGEGAFMLLIELRESPMIARKRIEEGFKMK